MMWLVVTFCNAAPYISRCIATIRAQTGTDFQCIFYDDCSSDTSTDIVEEAASCDSRIKLVRNVEKVWQSGNWLKFAAQSDVLDSDIVVTMDGDDWFPDPWVLDRVMRAYADNRTLVTYGNFAYWQNERIVKKGYCRPIDDVGNVRSHPWVSSALRTFRALLLRRIDEEDFMWEGSHIPSAADHALMFAALEMAGQGRYRCLPDVNYIYNIDNPANTFKVRRHATQEIVARLRGLPKYPELCDTCVAAAVGASCRGLCHCKQREK